MGRQGAIVEPGGDEQRSQAVRIHDEWRGSRVGVQPPRLLAPVNPVVRRLLAREVGNVVSGPFLALRVPPEILLPLRPGAPIRIGGGPVVQDAAVGRPGEAPVEMRAGPGAIWAWRVRPAVAGQVLARLGSDPTEIG